MTSKPTNAGLDDYITLDEEYQAFILLERARRIHLAFVITICLGVAMIELAVLYLIALGTIPVLGGMVVITLLAFTQAHQLHSI